MAPSRLWALSVGIVSVRSSGSAGVHLCLVQPSCVGFPRGELRAAGSCWGSFLLSGCGLAYTQDPLCGLPEVSRGQLESCWGSSLLSGCGLACSRECTCRLLWGAGSDSWLVCWQLCRSGAAAWTPQPGRAAGAAVVAAAPVPAVGCCGRCSVGEERGQAQGGVAAEALLVLASAARPGLRAARLSLAANDTRLSPLYLCCWAWAPLGVPQAPPGARSSPHQPLAPC